MLFLMSIKNLLKKKRTAHEYERYFYFREIISPCRTNTKRGGTTGIYSGVLIYLEFYAFKIDCVKMLGVMCADSDTSYWRPIILKMAASAQ